MYDLISIGGGPAGESATELAAFFGHRCLIVEKDKLGGAVTTTGGVPTKTLREAALYFSSYRERGTYGVRLQAAPTIALDEIRRRTWHVCESLQKAAAKNVAKHSVKYLTGTARLQPDRAVTIQAPDGREQTLRGKVVLIATGSRPAPEGPDLPIGHPGICNTDTILKRGHPPRSLLIVGGGPVAVEFATIASAMDIDVTIVNLGDRLLGSMDGEISFRLTRILVNERVKIVAGATLKTVRPDGDWLNVDLTSGKALRVDTILFAAGRVGNTENLGLAAAGIAVDERGRIPVDGRFQTSREGVYAAGDVVKPSLASVAMDQGRVAACHALGIPLDGVIDPVSVSAVYGMPEVARVGLTEEECIERSLDYEIGRAEFAETPRGAIAGREGLLKLIFLKGSRKLIGVHCIGDIASELVAAGQMAIRCNETIHIFSNMTLNTPTYTYAYKYAAFDGIRRLMTQPVKQEPVQRSSQ